MKWLEGAMLLLGVIDKLIVMFKKTPSQKIAKQKEKLQDKIDKRKKTGRP